MPEFARPQPGGRAVPAPSYETAMFNFGDDIELIPVRLEPAEWAATVQTTVGGVTALAVAAGHDPTPLVVCELLRGMPATADGLTALGRLSDGSLLARSLTAVRRDRAVGQMEVIAAGLRRLVYQPPDRRALLEASIRGVFLGLSTSR